MRCRGIYRVYDSQAPYSYVLCLQNLARNHGAIPANDRPNHAYWDCSSMPVHYPSKTQLSEDLDAPLLRCYAPIRSHPPRSSPRSSTVRFGSDLNLLSEVVVHNSRCLSKSKVRLWACMDTIPQSIFRLLSAEDCAPSAETIILRA